MASLAGHCLVSNYALTDPHFAGSVVLIIEHTPKGAFGLVVNYITSLTLKDFFADCPQLLANKEIYRGGPVEPHALFILHNDSLVSHPGEEVLPGVFLGGTKELLQELADAQASFHLYHGYSGWGPGQLDKEMQNKAWVPVKATERMIFHPYPEKVWREALEYKGGLYKYFAQNVKDPFMN